MLIYILYLLSDQQGAYFVTGVQGMYGLDEKTIRIAYLMYMAVLLETLGERQGWRLSVIGSFTAETLLEESIEAIIRRTDQVLSFLNCIQEPEKYTHFRETLLAGS